MSGVAVMELPTKEAVEHCKKSFNDLTLADIIFEFDIRLFFKGEEYTIHMQQDPRDFGAPTAYKAELVEGERNVMQILYWSMTQGFVPGPDFSTKTPFEKADYISHMDKLNWAISEGFKPTWDKYQPPFAEQIAAMGKYLESDRYQLYTASLNNSLCDWIVQLSSVFERVYNLLVTYETRVGGVICESQPDLIGNIKEVIDLNRSAVRRGFWQGIDAAAAKLCEMSYFDKMVGPENAAVAREYFIGAP